MLELNDSNFVETIQGNDTVIIDFWAAWCGPCRSFAPVFEKAAADFPDVTFAKIDVDSNQQLAAAMGASSIPTIVAFRGGAMVYNQAGAMNSAQFSELVKQIKAVDLEEVKKAAAEQEAAADR